MWEVLSMTERTVSPEEIEDMTQELTSAIEDFDRAVNVQTLSLVKEQGIVAKEQGVVLKDIGKHSLPQFGDTSFSTFHT
jgi:formate dehydrogenase assembly factor FdhD